jgi:hypothetical protein
MSMGRRAISMRKRDGPGGHGGGAAAPGHGTVDGKPHIREMSTCTMMGKINKYIHHSVKLCLDVFY